jgi:uncharacterized phage protein (TIGR02218 family)
MSRTISPELAAHLSLESPTVCTICKVTRKDGTIYGFTEIDRDFSYLGVVYKGRTGYSASAIVHASGLNVGNLEIAGAFDSSAITASDLEAGLWDWAAVDFRVVNYLDLTMGDLWLAGGTIGQVKFDDVGRFWAEFLDIADRAQRNMLRIMSPLCDAILGDSRCTVNIGPFTATATVTSIVSTRRFIASSLAQAAAYFSNGLVTWTSGVNNGVKAEVKTHLAGGDIELHLPLYHPVLVGDSFSIVAGCLKRDILDCKTKFNNIVNFRGFPDMIGNQDMIKPNINP